MKIRVYGKLSMAMPTLENSGPMIETHGHFLLPLSGGRKPCRLLRPRFRFLGGLYPQCQKTRSQKALIVTHGLALRVFCDAVSTFDDGAALTRWRIPTTPRQLLPLPRPTNWEIACLTSYHYRGGGCHSISLQPNFAPFLKVSWLSFLELQGSLAQTHAHVPSLPTPPPFSATPASPPLPLPSLGRVFWMPGLPRRCPRVQRKFASPPPGHWFS